MDPSGCIHDITLDTRGFWWGTENLGNTFGEKSVRDVAKGGVIRSLQRNLNDHGTWGEFVWIRISPDLKLNG